LGDYPLVLSPVPPLARAMIAREIGVDVDAVRRIK
jgi:hypothetical protein